MSIRGTKYDAQLTGLAASAQPKSSSLSAPLHPRSAWLVKSGGPILNSQIRKSPQIAIRGQEDNFMLSRERSEHPVHLRQHSALSPQPATPCSPQTRNSETTCGLTLCHSAAFPLFFLIRLLEEFLRISVRLSWVSYDVFGIRFIRESSASLCQPGSKTLATHKCQISSGWRATPTSLSIPACLLGEPTLWAYTMGRYRPSKALVFI